MCSKYTLYAESGGNRKKSLNTGIVTFKNYGDRVPLVMSQITFAHEIGHNYGSPVSISAVIRSYFILLFMELVLALSQVNFGYNLFFALLWHLEILLSGPAKPAVYLKW